MRNYLIITFSILLLLSCTKDNEFDNSLKTKIDFVENLSESTKIAESEFGKRYEDALPKGGKIYDLKIGEFLYIYTYQKKLVELRQIRIRLLVRMVRLQNSVLR